MPPTYKSVPVHTSRLLLFRWPPLLLILGGLVLAVGVDADVVRSLNPEAPGWQQSGAEWVQNWSTRGLLLAAFAAFALAWLHPRFRAWRTPTTAFLEAWVLVEIVIGVAKRLIGRPRPVHPDGIAELIRPLYERPDLKSMPSGHVAVAMCGAIFFAASVRSLPLRVLAFLFVGFVAWGRMALGAHYPSDVLIGAGLAWGIAAFVLRLGLMNRFRFESFRPRPLERAAGAWALVLTLTWLLGAPRAAQTFANAGAPQDLDLKLTRPWGEVLLEPFTGPAAALAELPDLRLVAPIFAAWGLAALVLLVWRRRRRAWAPLAALVLWAGVVVTLGLGGFALGDRIQAPEGWRLVETQAHLGDPYDGDIGLDLGLRRYASLGFDAVLNTWHGQAGPACLVRNGAPLPLDTIEWSAGTPAESPLHLLVYLPSGKDLSFLKAKDWRDVLSGARMRGGVVFASHPWRGEASAIPPFATLLEAGLSGAEVAGRNPEWRAEPRARQREWSEALASAALPRTASGDFHGRRSVAAGLWLVASDPAESWNSEAAAREILEGLRGERPSLAVALGGEPPPPAMLGWAEPLWFGLDYLRGMSLRRRGAWLAWLAAAVILGRLTGWGRGPRA